MATEQASNLLHEALTESYNSHVAGDDVAGLDGLDAENEGAFAHSIRYARMSPGAPIDLFTGEEAPCPAYHIKGD